MLRNRPRAVSSNSNSKSKQALMADHTSQSSPSTKPIPSFFGSPRFKAFTLKSPTSILDNNKPVLFPFGNPFGYDIINQQNPKSPKLYSPNKKRHLPENPESKGIGLAMVDTLNNKPIEEDECSFQTSNKKVLFGTELRVQIPPPLQLLRPCLVSPTDFGTKSKTTRNSHLSSSPFGSPNSGFHNMKDSPNFTGPVAVKEMELSEDYTCVISHGPNPKTTHIFDNCIVDNYYCCVNSDDNNKPKPKSAPETESFLSFCHTCNKNLEQKIDIYIYRGEKAFCSQECRYQEMRLDGNEN